MISDNDKIDIILLLFKVWKCEIYIF